MSEEVLMIDVEKLVRQKYKGYLPKCFFSWLKQLIRQDELNELNRKTDTDKGVEAAKMLLDHLNISVEWVGEERLPHETERLLFVGNHPLGGADGVALSYLLGTKYNGNIRLLVNDLLLNLKQFRDIFVPVNKYGHQGKDRADLMMEALESDNQVFSFPAGLCSRQDQSGQVRDLEWKTSFIRMAQRYERDIVPLYFEGCNSPRFYRWSRWRKRLGVKFNYELILLPDELLKAKGKHFKVYVGDRIPYASLPTGSAMRPYADKLRDSLYNIPKELSQVDSTDLAVNDEKG